jgi:nicotinic acid mononucleotide adenylyltransferase
MNKITVLFPGGFKPLTGAHLALAQRYAESPQVGQVIYTYRTYNPRDGITREQTIEIFDLIKLNGDISDRYYEFNLQNLIRR